MILKACRIGVFPREVDGSFEVRFEQGEVALLSGLDPSCVRGRSLGGPALQEVGRNPLVKGDGHIRLFDGPPFRIVRVASLRLAARAVDGSLHVRIEKKVAGKPGQGGDLRAAGRRRCRRHHGPGIPRRAETARRGRR